MANEQRLKLLEKILNPDLGRVYVMIDNQGAYWVNGKAFSKQEFEREFDGRRINTIQVGLDISKV